MGAKTWMLVYADADPARRLRVASSLDQEKSLALARTLFPKDKLQTSGEGDLSFTCPADDQIVIGSFPSVAIVAAKEFGIDYPSRLSKHFLEHRPHSDVYLHAMHSAVDWFAFAHWSNGNLIRSLSLSPDSGVLEDFGPRLDFEQPSGLDTIPLSILWKIQVATRSPFIRLNWVRLHLPRCSAIRWKASQMDPCWSQKVFRCCKYSGRGPGGNSGNEA